MDRGIKPEFPQQQQRPHTVQTGRIPGPAAHAT